MKKYGNKGEGGVREREREREVGGGGRVKYLHITKAEIMGQN